MTGFDLLAAGPQAPLASASYQEWLTNEGDIAATFHRMADGYVVRFPGRADFVLINGSDAVECRPTGAVSEQATRFLYANQIVPLLQNRAGKLVLHGSAVACSERAIGFLGKSGRGKSTLAAAFARNGYPFFTDDGLLLEEVRAGFMVLPSTPNLGLWHDSGDAVLGWDRVSSPAELHEKLRIDASEQLPFQDRPLALQTLYILGPGDAEAVTIAALAPPAAFAEILQHAFILDIGDQARMRLHWKQMADLAERIPCFVLDFPRRYEVVPAVVEAVVDHVRTGVPAQ